MKRAKPGHVHFTSEEVEWLHAVILNACHIAERAGIDCNPTDRTRRILDKIDRARFEDATEVVVGSPKLEDAIMRAASLES
jgi:hypothetical protein